MDVYFWYVARSSGDETGTLVRNLHDAVAIHRSYHSDTGKRIVLKALVGGDDFQESCDFSVDVEEIHGPWEADIVSPEELGEFMNALIKQE